MQLWCWWSRGRCRSIFQGSFSFFYGGCLFRSESFLHFWIWMLIDLTFQFSSFSFVICSGVCGVRICMVQLYVYVECASSINQYK